MKYVVKNNLIVNRFSLNGIYPDSSFIESEEDLLNLFDKRDLCNYKVVDGIIVKRTEEDKLVSDDYKSLMRKLREAEYIKTTDRLKEDFTTMSLLGEPEEKIKPIRDLWLQKVLEIKQKYPIY